MAASAPYQDTQMAGLGNFESHQLRLCSTRSHQSVCEAHLCDHVVFDNM